MDKKGVFDAGAVWFAALGDFGEGLFEHVAEPGADRLRFQTGRLERSLVRRIKAEASGKDEWGLLFACYEFATNCSRHLGYDEARRLHGEEMAARGLASAGEFCSGMPKRFAVAPEATFLEELRSRVRSVAGWMECQESFALWLVFRDLRVGWRGSWEERARAVAACYLSRLHRKPGNAGRVVRGYGGKPWSDREWVNIMRQAAELVGKRYDCTQLERWEWWCYPVFRHYGWNTREVQQTAVRRGLLEEGAMYPENFRRHMLTLGLPLSGRKKARGSVGRLAEFVRRVVLPDPATMWGEASGLLCVTEKKR